MGKADDEQSLPSTTLDAQRTTGNSNNSDGNCCLGCSKLQKLVSLRCVLLLVFGVGVLLSALFFSPFFHFGHRKDLDLDYQGHDIVASFMLKKPVSFLQDYKSQLENDIFDEMSFSSTKVEIISLEPLAESNITKVVFAVESDVTTQSLIRENFVTLITRQSYLNLTSASLFGDPYSFEVLKFKGGITVSPEQKAYLLQSVQILFNFTLNFSVDQVLDNFDELTVQLKTGLRLTQYENLYLRFTNLKGSTVSSPTTVQSQVLLAVGINPSKSRLKQLAQTITSSHAKNLGLNNTVFGRVKQIRLSSILQHSLGNEGMSPSPSPSPSEAPHHHHHHHHHHHNHHHDSLPPTISPSPSIGKGGSAHGKRHHPTLVPIPAPSPRKSRAAKPPCHFGYNPWNRNRHPHLPPPVAPPVYPPTPSAAPSRAKPKVSPAPKVSSVPVESPLPNVAYAHSQPPTERHPDVLPLVSPSPSMSSAGAFSSSLMAIPLFIVLVLQL